MTGWGAQARNAVRRARGSVSLVALVVVIAGLLLAAGAGVAIHQAKSTSPVSSAKPAIGRSTTTAPGPGGTAGTSGTSGTSGTVGRPPGTAGSVPSPPTSLPPVPALSWRSCNGVDGPRGFQCATLQVPLDYANPSGTKIGIALDRKRATGTKIGSLLFNPGGPGASGVDFLPSMGVLLTSSVQSHFDLIGFDPRGVGRSAPVRCETGPQLDQFVHTNPAPTTSAGFQQLLSAATALEQGCEARSGALLPFVGTVNGARDMDEIRAAVGDAKLTYVGFSYGTVLGATYADLFPTHIRAMVLDGALDPALDPIQVNIQQASAFDKELNDFFAYCTGNTLCPWQPQGNLKADYDALMARIAASPLPGDGTRTVGPGEAFFGVAETLYDSGTWPDLATALSNADGGDGSLLLQFSDTYTERNANGVYTNSLEANNAISCVDQPWPHDPSVIERDAAAAKQQAPEFGVADLYGALPCTSWPVPPTSQPHVITAAGSPAIVVVGSTGDPATPYQFAQGLARELQSGVLLTRVGDGHTGYRSSACIRSHVDSYLVSLTVPAPGISCPSS